MNDVCLMSLLYVALLYCFQGLEITFIPNEGVCNLRPKVLQMTKQWFVVEQYHVRNDFQNRDPEIVMVRLIYYTHMFYSLRGSCLCDKREL